MLAKAVVKRTEARFNADVLICCKAHFFIVREDGADAAGVHVEPPGEAVSPMVLGVGPRTRAANGYKHRADSLNRGRHCRIPGRL